ncbi:MAG: twin-arginine translocase subunit TatC [Bacteroidota bacterium]
MAIFSWRKRKNPSRREGQEAEMSFFEHLEELRWHLMRIVIAIIAIGVVLFIYRQEVIGGVFMTPFKGDFPTFRFLCNYISPQFCNVEIPVSIQAISPYEQFMRAMGYSFFGGIIVAFPYITWELWRFIRPALSRKERRKVRWNVMTTSLLFFVGVFFGYFILLPISIQFLSNFELFAEAENIWRIGDVINFEMLLLFGTGLLFQLPVVTYYLSKLGLLTPQFLKRYRRHAIVVLLLLAALITPPDPFTQIVIFLPLITLYQIGIGISRRVYRRKEREELAERKAIQNAKA